jgi:hypothetical protein
MCTVPLPPGATQLQLNTSYQNTSSLCTFPSNAVALWLGTGTHIAATIVFNSVLPLITGQTENQEHMSVVWQVTTVLTGVIIHARHMVNTTKVIFYCVQVQVIQVKCIIILLNTLPIIRSIKVQFRLQSTTIKHWPDEQRTMDKYVTYVNLSGKCRWLNPYNGSMRTDFLLKTVDFIYTVQQPVNGISHRNC